jgi:hypothetical protein
MRVILFIALWVTGLHPIHISVTEIEYDERERELEITTRIFTDDFETAIRKERNLPELDLLEPSGGMTTDDLVKEYVLKQISISLDGKLQRLNYLGFENDGEALICYIQMKNVKKWKSITVTNRVLLDVYDDQSNIVHVTMAGKVRSMRLMEKNPTQTITF